MRGWLVFRKRLSAPPSRGTDLVMYGKDGDRPWFKMGMQSAQGGKVALWAAGIIKGAPDGGGLFGSGECDR